MYITFSDSKHTLPLPANSPQCLGLRNIFAQPCHTLGSKILWNKKTP